MKKLALFSILIVGLFSACSLEEPSTLATKSDAGTLASNGYVAIGNSLTAGYQSGSLLESRQQFSYPNLIAQQLGVETFAQPTVSYPGIPNILELQSFDGTIAEASGTGAPTNLEYPAPYNNLGIPGIVLADVMNSTSTAGSEAAGFSGSGLIDLVLRGLGTVYQQAKIQKPSFMTVWIGNNDVLGYATSGGAKPTAPVDVNTFAFLYSQMADSLETIGAKVAVANIPSVTDVPFFTTIGPKMAPGIAGALAADTTGLLAGLVYQDSDDIIGSAVAVPNADATDLMDPLGNRVLITLKGGAFASLLGQPTGAWYRDLAASIGIPVGSLLATMPGIDTTQAFGFHPQNPWPHALILDASEIIIASDAVDSYNNTISSIASAKGWALVDINSKFAAVTAQGGVYFTQGLVMSTAYIAGEFFSLDGVHPTNMGYGVAANWFIESINAKFGTSIAPVNLRKLRETGSDNPVSASINRGALDNTLSILGAK
jgi:lysophospholipase L1-like esterase